jgi:acid phosphatase
VRIFRRGYLLIAAALILVAAVGVASSAAKPKPKPVSAAVHLAQIKHIVVVYEENHSFDNLYGGWEGVNGLSQADQAHTTQVDQNGAPLACVAQNDVNLTTPPLTPSCNSTSAFKNAPFLIDQFIPASATTCPKPIGAFAANGFANGTGLPGGCTKDIVHRYYQEQYQLDGGKQDRYTTGSDAVGLTMGYYDTKALPIYRYLHEKNAPHYAISERFFQGAFGGSFLNHQVLVAGTAPTWASADNAGDANDSTRSSTRTECRTTIRSTRRRSARA